jgi:hypothetical protein
LGNVEVASVVSGAAIGLFMGTKGVAGTLCGGSMRQQSKNVIIVMVISLHQQY